MRLRIRSRPALLLTGFFLTLCLSGCVTLKDPEASQEQSRFVLGTLEGGHTVAQSFVSRRAGLNGIWLWLNVAQDSESGDGNLIVQLYHAPREDTPLATVIKPLRSLSGANPIQFSLPVQLDPPGQAYYLTLLATSGKVEALGLNEDVYPSGTAYLDSTPLQGDLAFRTSYDYNLAAWLGDVRTFLEQIWLALPLALILLFPGWLAWRHLSDRSQAQKADWGEKLTIAIGLSMAIIPVLMLWTTIAHLPWSRIGLLLVAGLIVVITLWDSRKRDLSVLPAVELRDGQSQEVTIQRPGWVELGLLVIFIAALAIRLIMVRDLAAPAWVDSVHHSLVTRLILEHGGYPDTYSPYLDIVSTRYHPGFHSLLAAFQWLSGVESLQAMLIFGQVLNALSVLAVYLLTKTLTGDRLAGLIAALITGFVTPMPAYYASWGRYTQLAGMLILPTAYNLVQSSSFAWVRRSATWKTVLLPTIACAGLFLVHYRVVAFMACLLIAEFATRLFEETLKVSKTFRVKQWLREVSSKHLREILAVGLVAIASMALLLPWLPSTLTTMILPAARTWHGDDVALFSGFAWTFLTTAWGKYSLYLAGLGLIWSIARKPRLAITLTLWLVMLFILANSASVGWFPNYINNTSVEIALFMPISTLGGYFASQVIQQGARWIPLRFNRMYSSGIIATGFVVAYLAARQLLPILNPVTFLFRQADRPALTWIQEHVLKDDTILINPFRWGYGLYAGNDGGYWITPLTGRKTLPPPLLYGLDPSSSTVKEINQLSQQVIDRSQDAETLHALLREQDIRYIYIGARGGVLSANVLQDSPQFTMLYHGEGTWVFQVK